jgi:hypothetical protein
MGMILAEKFDGDEYRRQALWRAAAAIGGTAIILGAAWTMLPRPAA